MFKTGTSITGIHSDRSYPSIRTLLQQLIDVKNGLESDNLYIHCLFHTRNANYLVTVEADDMEATQRIL